MQAPFAICLLRLQVGVLTGGIEAGAILSHVGKFAVPHDASLWVIPSKRFQQLIECLLLGWPKRAMASSAPLVGSPKTFTMPFALKRACKKIWIPAMWLGA